MVAAMVVKVAKVKEMMDRPSEEKQNPSKTWGNV